MVDNRPATTVRWAASAPEGMSAPFELPVAVGFGTGGGPRPGRPPVALTLVGDSPAYETAADPTPTGRLLRLVTPAPALPPAGPARLTARGRIVSGSVAVAIGIALIVTAWSGSPRPAPAGPVSARVVVHAGDTLWSIAERIAPGRDPRDEVADLRRLNVMAGTLLSPGQILRTR